jgi:hypothetical protein
MARLAIDNDSVTVALDGIERLGTFHTTVTVGRDQVRSVRVVDDPFSEVRGIRAPGVSWPRSVSIGRWRRRGGTDLVVVRRGQRAVLLELDGTAAYRRLLIGVSDPDAVIDELSGAPASS